MFFDNLKKICKERGTSPTRVAKEIGIGGSNITRWKNGLIPSGATLMKISEHLGISIDKLLKSSDCTNSSINYSVVAQGQKARAINGAGNGLHTNEGSEELTELTRIYNSLSVKKRVELLQRAWELEGNKNE